MSKQTLTIEVTENATKGLELLSVYAQRHLLDKLYPNPDAAAIRTDLFIALEDLYAETTRALTAFATARAERIGGARHALKLKEAYRLLRHYGIPSEVLDIDYENGDLATEHKVGAGFWVGAVLTSHDPARARRRFYLRANEDDCKDWKEVLTNALAIARNIDRDKLARMGK